MSSKQMMSAYNKFYDKNISHIKIDNPGIENTRASWIIIRLWQNLNKEEQLKYYTLEKHYVHGSSLNWHTLKSSDSKK